MKATGLVAIGVGALLLGWWGFAHEAARPAAAAAAAPGQVDARDREIAELKARLARLEASQRPTAPAASATPAAALGAAPPGEDARPPEVLAREAEIAKWMEDHYTPEVQANVFGMYFADVDRVRLAETPDEAWGAAIDRGVRELLASAQASLGNTAIKQLECGRTLCRIKLDVGKPAERGHLVHLIQQALKLEEASVYMPSSGALLEGYFARAGSSLPQFDQIKDVGVEMSRLGAARP